MGSSGKWLKSLITTKKLQTATEQENSGDKSKKKWKLWRSTSEAYGSSSSIKGMKRGQVESSDSSGSTNLHDDRLTAAMAAVARAPPKHFKLVKQEWAAIRIQTVFRSFLARRAFRALKAVVRIQAIFRGRQVRKQAAVTLRCMQALVRVQARIRAQSVQPSELDSNQDEEANLVNQKGWCDYPGTADEVISKLQMKQEGVVKRERALAYTVSTQRSNSRTRKLGICIKPKSSEWSWLDGWMAEKAWESRSMGDIKTDPLFVTSTPFSRKSENLSGFYSHSSEQQDSVKVTKNHVSTRVSARPPPPFSVSQTAKSSLYDEYSASSSSTSNNNNTEEEIEVGSSVCNKPSYMNLTASRKAKQRSVSRFSSPNREYYYNSRSSTGSDNSSRLSKDLYPQSLLVNRRDNWVRY